MDQIGKGCDDLNRMIRATCLASRSAKGCPEIIAAACGDFRVNSVSKLLSDDPLRSMYIAAGGGFMTARGTANLMTRVTTVLAAGFFTTSIILAIMASAGNETVSIVDDVINSTPAPVSGPAVPTDK